MSHYTNSTTPMSQQPYTIATLELAIADLEPNPWNPNEMSDFMLAKAEESLERFGLVTRPLVRPHPQEKGRYQILNGYHRLKVLGDQGWTKVPCDVIHDISDNEAKRLGLALNDVHGQNDREKLGQILCEIQAQDDDGGLPWHEDELAHLMALGDTEEDEDDEDEIVPDEFESPESPQDTSLQTVVLRLTPTALDKLKQAGALLKSELPEVEDNREFMGLVVERVCEEYV